MADRSSAARGLSIQFRPDRDLITFIWTLDPEDARSMPPDLIFFDDPNGITYLIVCGCGHVHKSGTPCVEWRLYPEVLNPRQCGCKEWWAPHD